MMMALWPWKKPMCFSYLATRKTFKQNSKPEIRQIKLKKAIHSLSS